jgi:membrane protease YdiL (CAAX protease family)
VHGSIAPLCFFDIGDCMELLLKAFWKKRHANELVIGFLFAILFAAVRGFGMLGPGAVSPLIPLGFVVMMILPFIFLTSQGRQQIGLKKSDKLLPYFIAIIYGVLAATLCFALGILFFDKGPDNWFVTIANYYIGQVPGAMDMPIQRFFIIVTVPALIFSPIGEEIFFRGFLQDALQSRFGLQVSMIIESGIFGLVHLFHHGLVRSNGGIQFYPVSGMLWVMLMFVTAYGFALLRKRSGSIYPAIVAHAVFNLTMNYFIFFNFLLKE